MKYVNMCFVACTQGVHPLRQQTAVCTDCSCGLSLMYLCFTITSGTNYC